MVLLVVKIQDYCPLACGVMRLGPHLQYCMSSYLYASLLDCMCTSRLLNQFMVRNKPDISRLICRAVPVCRNIAEHFRPHVIHLLQSRFDVKLNVPCVICKMQQCCQLWYGFITCFERADTELSLHVSRYLVSSDVITLVHII